MVADHATLGARLRLIAEASDGNVVSGPGRGRSRPVVLRVVDEDELRRDIERGIAAARDAVVQARSQLQPALSSADPGLTAEALASVGQPLARAEERLAEVQRRWRINRLDQADGAQMAEIASDLTTARAERHEVGELETQLGAIERRLAALLRSDDLVRVLADLVRRQAALTDDTRMFVRAHLIGALDAPAQAQIAGLVRRQDDLVASLDQWVTVLVADHNPAFDPARELMRDRRPEQHLATVGAQLVTARQQALATQLDALTVLEEVLASLRADAADDDLATWLGDLAQRQDRLRAAAEAGADGTALAAQQADLSAETEQAAERLANQGGQEAAQRTMAAATAAQGRAQQAMAAGDRSAAAESAASASALLREAQRSLDEAGGEDQAAEDQADEGDEQADVIALLRELRRVEASVLARGEELQRRLGAADRLAFADRRQVAALAVDQRAIGDRLEAEGMAVLDESAAIARRSLQRVLVTSRRAERHLNQPALGERGIRLISAVLAEIDRLLRLIEAMPKPDQEQQASTDEGGDSGGDSGAGEPPPPFPASAEVALLVLEQVELGRATAGNYPADLAALQRDIAQLTSNLAD
ncbi:MAG: hypothetical protein ACYTF0_09430, partial [Planctomycetota bacterium]